MGAKKRIKDLLDILPRCAPGSKILANLFRTGKWVMTANNLYFIGLCEARFSITS